MPQNITIAKLNTLVTANAAQFTSEMARAGNVAKEKGSVITKSFDRLGESVRDRFAELGVALAGDRLFEYGKSVIELGSHIKELAEAAGMSNRTFQVLSAAAAQHGIEMEQMARASEHLRSSLETASEKGSDPLNASLKHLHLTADGLKNLAPEEQWEVIARRVEAAKDKQQAFNIVSDMFGEKIGPKMRAVLEDLAKGYKGVEDRMSGLVLTDDELRRLQEADHFWSRFGMAGKVSMAESITGHGVQSSPGFGIGDFTASLVERLGDKISGKSEPKNLLNPNSMSELLLASKTLEQKMKESEQTEAGRKLAEIFNNPHDFRPDYNKEMLHDLMTPEQLRKKLLQGKPFPLNVPTDSLSRIGLMTGAMKSPQDEAAKQTNKHMEKANHLLELIFEHLKHGMPATFEN